MLGTLATTPALDRAELLAAPVLACLLAMPPAAAAQVLVAPIDPDLADTAAFCAAYQVGLDVSANCVIVAGRRGETTRMAAAVVLATTRADVNTTIRKHLDARRASFAPMDDAVEQSGMAYGGVTPFGLPVAWPVLVDPAVVEAGLVVVGSGIRGSKLVTPAAVIAALPAALVLPGVAVSA